ncbi:MAG: hypothetical protein M0Z46_17080 [Actinomycetota bacterium]|nr:hypothetical protein [Actinomycetota bacterium]
MQRHRPQRGLRCLDPTAKRVYGSLWSVLCEVVEMHPHSGTGGLMTLVGLCSEATVEELVQFVSRLNLPLPGVGQTAARWLEHHQPPETSGGAPFEVGEKLLAWGREDPAQRLWAAIGLTWGLDSTSVMESFCELREVGAHPRALGAPAVVALAAAAPREIPRHLKRRRGLDEVCAEIAADTGVAGGRGIDVVLPAAMSAAAAALAADLLNGVAACGLLIRSRPAADIDPERLESVAREGTPAATLARLLARLWRTVWA